MAAGGLREGQARETAFLLDERTVDEISLLLLYTICIYWLEGMLTTRSQGTPSLYNVQCNVLCLQIYGFVQGSTSEWRWFVAVSTRVSPWWTMGGRLNAEVHTHDHGTA